MINLDEKDIKIKTLAGLPFHYKGLTIYAPTLKEIIEMSEVNYNKCLALLHIEKKDLIPEEYLHLFENNTVFEIILGIDEFTEYKEILKLFFKYFLKVDEYNFDEKLVINNLEISQPILEDIRYVVDIQNMRKRTDIDKQTEFNLKDDKAKALYEKLLKQRQKVAELKHKAAEENGDNLELYDLITIVTTGVNGINLLNVFDLNLLRFNIQYSRMINLDRYNISIQSLLAGADPKNVKVENWIKKAEY